MTVRIDLAKNEWTEVVSDASADFLLENPTGYAIDIYIGDAPDASSAHHQMLDVESIARVVPGKIWARPSLPDLSIPVIVSV